MSVTNLAFENRVPGIGFSASSIRIRAFIFAVVQGLVLLVMIAGTHGWIVRNVGPTSTDYVSFYAAGALANTGHPAEAYQHNSHWQAEQEATQLGVPYQYFFNPPTFLLVMAPLARLPYLASFLLFQALSLTAWLLVGTRAAGGGSVAPLALLAVPSLWWVLGLGQNSFLSVALLGAGLMVLPTRPIMAGIAFGALCYKPHLALVLPVALVAGRAWRAIAAAAVTVAGAIGATLFLYGPETWEAFRAMTDRNLSGAIDSGRVLLAARADPTGALQMVGFPLELARLCWLLLALAALTTVALIWRRASPGLRNATAAASVLIVAPFALFYDLVIASLSAAFLIREGVRTGFLRGEPGILASLVVLDLLAAHPVVAATRVPFGALISPVLLGLCIRRWRDQPS